MRALNLATLQSLSSIGLWLGFILAIVSALFGTAGNWASQEAGDILQTKNETLQKVADERQKRSDERIAVLNVIALQAQKDIELSKQKTAEANRSAEIAKAEAAESKRKTAEISVELEHARSVLASRFLTEHQKLMMLEELRGAHLTIAICFQEQDNESTGFAENVYLALIKSGQEVRLLGDACGERINMSAGVTAISMTGRHTDPSNQDRDPLYRALIRAGIWGGWGMFPTNIPPDITHLLIISARSAPSIEALRRATPLPQPKLR